MGWWMANAWNESPVALVSWIVWVVGSIVLHELAHGWAAIRCGDDVPLRTGHMTGNPFVHIPPMAWIFFLLVGITWGLMPTNPANYRGRYDDAKVAFAGPLVNLILAVCASLALALWTLHGSGIINDAFYQNMSKFLETGVMLNLALFMLNMLPVPPLDGSRILATFVPSVDRLFQGERAQIMLVVGMVLVFMFAGRIIWPLAYSAASVLDQFWANLL